MSAELAGSAVEKRASIVNVSNLFNPWAGIAKSWSILEYPQLYQSVITLGDLEIKAYLPVAFPTVADFCVYWDVRTDLTVKIGQTSHLDMSTNTANLLRATNDTWSMLQAAFGARFPIHQGKFVMEFIAHKEPPLIHQMGRQSVIKESRIFNQTFSLIRDKLDSYPVYLYDGILGMKPPIEDVQNPYKDYEDTPNDSPHLSLTKLPRRLDFLHRLLPRDSSISKKPYSAVLPVSRCMVDDLAFKFVRFGLMIPSIMRRFEVHFIAEELSNTILKNVKISQLSLIVTAICASSAFEESNYQRLEFLGDSILKVCTSVQLMAAYPLWHEGYLSAKKDHLVANSRLSRAAIQVGLDRFIITKAFTGHKWRPKYVDDLLKTSGDTFKREMSTKVLADVVEALVGSAMVDGGIQKALACLQVFLPELDWQPLENRRSFLYQRTPEMALPRTLEPLEHLMGYQFKKKSLLVEALTHASFRNSGSSSFERLEFLGDSILDNIIVTAMYGQNIELSHIQMHRIRTALVNADFLAFMCMEWSFEQEVVDSEVGGAELNGGDLTIKQK